MHDKHQRRGRVASDLADTLNGTLRAEQEEIETCSSAANHAFLNVIRSRADLGVHLFIDGPIIVGRDHDCSIRLHDFRVSRRHAEIVPRPDGSFTLRDLGSTNGTKVNGRKICGYHILQDGEKIYIGDTVLRFSLGDELEVQFHSEVAAMVGSDPLTGLPSKRRFDQAFEFSLDTAKKCGGSLALLMMDMDGVKQINDTHGHLFGAHAIGQTGRLIAQVLGPRGQACRFGGDEFSAFLPSTDLSTARSVAEQIRQTVERAEMELNGIRLSPTISIGVACFPDAGTEPLDLVAQADEALYRAKAKGKNQVAA
jgi:diguanylate cyclase (GGDEF)-like protein